MRNRLANRHTRSGNMASGATTRDVAVIHRDRARADKGCRRHAMTIITHIRGRRMRAALG